VSGRVKQEFYGGHILLTCGVRVSPVQEAGIRNSPRIEEREALVRGSRRGESRPDRRITGGEGPSTLLYRGDSDHDH